MKIVYSIGNRIGFDLTITRIKDKLSKNNVIKIGSYNKLADYNLNDLFFETKDSRKSNKLFKHSPIPRMDYNKAKNLLLQIEEFSPDLIICDFEHVVANIANTLSIPLWYCSSLHVFDGCFLQRGVVKNTLLDSTRKQLSFLPKAERIFVYSPLGDLDNAPKLKTGFDWISPYSEDYKKNAIFADKMFIADNLRNEKLKSTLKLQISKEQIVLDGNTNFLSDVLYFFTGNVFISPDYSNPEQILNALSCHDLKIATNLGQLEKAKSHDLDDVILFHHEAIKPKHPFLEEFLI